MKILQTEALGALSGETLRLIDEVRYINEHTPHVARIVGPDESDFMRRAAPEVPYEPFRYHRFDYYPPDYYRAYRLVRELDPDVVHTHSSQDAWMFGLAAKLQGRPVVRGRHITKTLPRNVVSRFVYSHLADAFTVTGRTIGDMFIDAGLAGEEDVFVTPAGLDFERFDPDRKRSSFLRDELDLPGNSWVVGTVCFLREWKGVDTLIRAFLNLRGRMDRPGHLVIAGKGDDRDRLEEIARPASEHVHFLGFREDVPAVIGGMDVFVLASKGYEATSQVLPQAMAMEVPVIGSEVGGIPDVIESGKTGLLVPPEAPDQLANAVRRFLTMDPEVKGEMTRRAREVVKRRFSLESVVRNYLQAYERALARR